jgi:succinyl-CoA synthetase beta subunit
LLDAKVNIDESASYRQNELLELREQSEVSEDVDPNEVKANEVGINYLIT